MPKVSEFMTQNVVTTSPEASIYETSCVMTEKNIGSLVVLENKVPVGIITERDVIRRVISKKDDPTKTLVRSIMSKPIVACAPECSLEEAASLMRQHKIKRLAVLKGAELVGMFTSYDLMIAIGREFDMLQATLTELTKEK
ncbi:MAG: CBS domain-containing protein [Candidatus Verstraetearchaeota archaeon]|nr:CBS domain-containing protein [Candidatus Verstraetearchaeota archaeon]